MPGNEVLIGRAPSKFDKESGDLLDEATEKLIDTTFKNFTDFVTQATK